MQKITIDGKAYPFVFGFEAQLFALDAAGLKTSNDLTKLVDLLPFRDLPQLVLVCINTGCSLSKEKEPPTIEQVMTEFNRNPLMAAQVLWDLIANDITPPAKDPDPKNLHPRTPKQ